MWVLVSVQFCNHLTEKERVDCVTLKFVRTFMFCKQLNNRGIKMAILKD